MYKQTNTICKPKRIQIFELIRNCTIIIKIKSRFSRKVYAISDRIWCNKHLRHTTTEKYYNNGYNITWPKLLSCHPNSPVASPWPLFHESLVRWWGGYKWALIGSQITIDANVWICDGNLPVESLHKGIVIQKETCTMTSSKSFKNIFL